MSEAISMRPAKLLRLALRTGLDPYRRIGFTTRVTIQRNHPRDGWTTATIVLLCGTLEVERAVSCWRHSGDGRQRLAAFVLCRDVQALGARAERMVNTASARLIRRALEEGRAD